MIPFCTTATTTVAWRNQNERSGASNQADLQTLDALKSGITCDHHGFRPQVQAASRLQGIGGAQPMLDAQLSSQLNDSGAEFHNQQIRLGKQRLKTVQAGLIALPQWSNTTLQNAQTADSQREIRCSDGKLLEGCLGGFSPLGLTIHQIDQGAGIQEGNHQSRSAASSPSISALLRGVVDDGRVRFRSACWLSQRKMTPRKRQPGISLKLIKPDVDRA